MSRASSPRTRSTDPAVPRRNGQPRVLSRGDLRVHAEAVRIDGTLEARLRGALDAVIRQTGATA